MAIKFSWQIDLGVGWPYVKFTISPLTNCALHGGQPSTISEMSLKETFGVCIHFRWLAVVFLFPMLQVRRELRVYFKQVAAPMVARFMWNALVGVVHFTVYSITLQILLFTCFN